MGITVITQLANNKKQACPTTQHPRPPITSPRGEFCAPKIEEMKTNNKLCATFQDKDKWLSLAGKGRIENDNALKQEMWCANSDKLKKWFPEDKKLDDHTLLELETQWGEYWDSTGVMKPLQYGVEALKSVVTGTRMDANKAGNHAKL